MAVSLNFTVVTLRVIKSLMLSVIIISSKMAILPLYPVSLQWGHPSPLYKIILFLSISYSSRIFAISGVNFISFLHFGHILRTNLCAIIPITEDEIKKGSIPISINLKTELGASLV